ncbi:MAG TPA: hypothetical protein VF613_09110 [Longimicrobium sp.]|jgi:hypothetical protein
MNHAVAWQPRAERIVPEPDRIPDPHPPGQEPCWDPDETPDELERTPNPGQGGVRDRDMPLERGGDENTTDW